MLRPLHDHVLIRPERAPDRTDSGLLLVEHAQPEQVGVVVAVGRPTHPRKLDAEELATWLDRQSDTHREAANLLRELVRRDPCVKVGDTVLFSWATGQDITVNEGEADGERYLLMREDDLLAVLETV